MAALLLAVHLCLISVGDGVARGQNANPNRLAIYRRNHRKLHDQFAQTLESLAEWCDEKGYSNEAEQTRDLAAWQASDGFHPEALPTKVQDDIPLDLSPDERYFKVQLRYHRNEYAKDLYVLSRQALHGGFISYAFSLVREAAFHDPDHKAARNVLGYVRYQDDWVTPFAAKMLRERYTWTEEFGWLPKTHEDRYQAGERYFAGRWMTAAKEAELRQDFRNAWQVRSEHYLVKTNYSLERGVELSEALEDFYQIFFETFASFFNSPDQMLKVFNGTGVNKRTQQDPLTVHYYRTRDEYVQTLKGEYPQIGITNSMYLTGPRVSFTYHDADAATETALFHEATHQLFYESEPRQRMIATDRNFWIVEGIACYMESYQRENGRIAIGDPKYQRFVAARHRYVVDGYYLPLRQFVEMGMYEFQSHPNISKNYSQASGLAHFFMHYDGGRYREALTQHLAQIYSADIRVRRSVAGLDGLTGVDYEELDRQYGQYMQNLGNALEEGQSLAD